MLVGKINSDWTNLACTCRCTQFGVVDYLFYHRYLPAMLIGIGRIRVDFHLMRMNRIVEILVRIWCTGYIATKGGTRNLCISTF